MFNALKIGQDFWQACSLGASGKVHSVFERAINIEVSEDGRLLTLLCEDGDIMPANCTTCTPDGLWKSFAKVGDKVLFTPDIVYIDNIARINRIANAEPWKQLSAEAIAAIGKPAYTDILALGNVVEKYLTKKAGKDCLSPNYALALLNPLNFIGLGAGLTPAGDDFLAGMLHSLHFMEKLYGKRPCYLLENTQIIAENLHRTGTISRHFLRYALNGEWGQSTENFFVSLVKGKQKELYDAVDVKLSYGASSGADELRGCLFAIKETLKDYQ